METKANNIVIGLFALATIVFAFLFVLWIGQIQLSREFTTYTVYFRGSVSGLSVGSPVSYNGIQIGDVKVIRLDDSDPNLVRVQIEVEAQTPVKEDTKAMLTYLGVTGVSYIELTGGSAGSAVLKRQKGEEFPVIQSERSGFQELMESAPNILAQSNLLLLQGAKLLSDENIAKVSELVENLERVSGAIADRDEEIGKMIANASEISSELTAMSRDLRQLTARTNDMMEEDVPSMVTEIRSAATTIDRFADNANSLLEDNRASITQFSTEGLGEMNALLAEARQTIATLERLASEIEEDPTVLLGQDKYPEYSPN